MTWQTKDGKRVLKAKDWLPFFFWFSNGFTSLLILLGACAKQAPPSGGPPDHTSPKVVWTIPAADSVGIGLKEKIQIGFSERMNHRLVERAVFLSPRPSNDPTFRWVGRELQILLAKGFRQDQTYLVTVGIESADLWGNRMVAPYSFAFGTGRVLNRSEILGQILLSSLGGSEKNYIWAYDLSEKQSPDPGQKQPDFVTQTGKNGSYIFSRLGPGSYRIFAFEDRNRDRTYTPSIDPIAVPSRDVLLSYKSVRIRLGMLRMVLRDTVPPTLLSIRATDERHVLLRFDEDVRLLEELFVIGPGGPLGVLASYQDPLDSSRVGLLTEPQLSGVDYLVDLTGIADRFGNRIGSDQEGRVRGDGRKDRRMPTVISTFPGRERLNIFPNDSLLIDFSEAMSDQIPSIFWVRSDSTVVPEGSFSWIAPNRLQFRSTIPWKSGQIIKLVGHPGLLSDYSGNELESAPVFEFGVYGLDELGSLSGSLVPTIFSVIVEARGLSPLDQNYRIKVAPGDSVYKFQGLIPGQYQIVAFLDIDGDGEWSKGSILPFVPSDPITKIPDTFEVRSRWEVISDRNLRPDTWFLNEIKIGQDEKR